jgi:hypothetical protein
MARALSALRSFYKFLNVHHGLEVNPAKAASTPKMDKRLPLISATGSCAMGRKVGTAVSQRLGRSLLELGGNNGMILTPSADLELATRAIVTIRRQATLLQEDTERLASWVGIARQERNQSLSQVATRLAIVLALIGLILVIAYYLKKLPYKFIKESRNLYYLRKIIGFFAGLTIVVIILLNFVGDFGSISSVIGLAGAGLYDTVPAPEDVAGAAWG